MKRLWRKTMLLLMAGALLSGLLPEAGVLGASWNEYRLHSTVYNPDKDEYFQVFVSKPGDTFAYLESRMFDAGGNVSNYYYYDDTGARIIRILTAYDSLQKRYLVLYEHFEGSFSLAYLNAYVPNKPVGVMSSFCSNCSNFSLAMDSSTGRFVISYIDNANSRVVIQHFAPSGESYATQTFVASTHQFYDVIQETGVVHVGENRYFVAWKVNYQLFGKYVTIVPDGSGGYALQEGETVSFGTAYSGSGMALNADAEGTVTVLWQAGEDADTDYLSVSRAVYGSPASVSLSIELTRGSYSGNAGIDNLDIARLAGGDYAVLVERHHDAKTELIGIVVDSGLTGHSVSGVFARHSGNAGFDHLYAHLVHNSKKNQVDYFFNSMYGPVLRPFGVIFTPPPTYHNPRLSFDPSSGNYLMLATNRSGDVNTLQVHRFEDKPSDSQIVPIGTLESGEFLGYAAAYGDGRHLAVWVADSGTNLKGKYLGTGDSSVGAPDFTSPLSSMDTDNLWLFYHDAGERFVLFNSAYSGSGTTLEARTIKGNNVVNHYDMLADLGTDAHHLRVVPLGDGRFAAAWLDGHTGIKLQALRVDESGTISMDGSTLTIPTPWSSDSKLRVAAQGSDELIVAFDPLPGDSIKLWRASLAGNVWQQLETVPVYTLYHGGELLDFDVYAGGHVGHEPVVAWLWREADMLKKSLYFVGTGAPPDMFSTLATKSSHYGAIRFVQGRNRLNLFTEANSVWPPMETGIGLLPVSLDFEGELRDMGVTGPVTVKELVKYIRQLDMGRFGYALMSGIENMFDLIDPIPPQ